MPIEIKGLKGLPGMEGFSKSPYDRGLVLAKRQVSTIREIISVDDVQLSFGLVVLCTIHQGALHYECHLVEL